MPTKLRDGAGQLATELDPVLSRFKKLVLVGLWPIETDKIQDFDKLTGQLHSHCGYTDIPLKPATLPSSAAA